MRPDLRERVERVQRALDEAPDSYLMATFPAGLPADAAGLAALPADLADLLTVTNGPRAGQISIFAAERLPDMQFHCDDLDVLQGGRERWLCFAMGADFPLMIERATGAVWWFPELDAEDYFMTDRFERLTDGVEDFLDRYVLGAGYRVFSPSDDDWWYGFLRDQALAG